MKLSYFSAKYILPSLMVLGLLLRSSTCTKDATVYEANGKVHGGWASPQVWLLTQVQSGEVATVVVPPFTHSGTFEETSSSEGWWIPLPCATGGRVRIPVRGTITHTASGAHWTFSNMHFNACGTWTFTGSGEGNSSTNMPTATYVSGNIHLDENGPLGTNYQDGTWTGSKK